MKYADEYFAWQREELVKHIDKLNADAQEAMDNDPDLWIGKLTNNPDHWEAYGVYDPYTLDMYLADEAYVSLAELLRKELY